MKITQKSGNFEIDLSSLELDEATMNRIRANIEKRIAAELGHNQTQGSVAPTNTGSSDIQEGEDV